jgi:hypothetical protein
LAASDKATGRMAARPKWSNEAKPARSLSHFFIAGKKLPLSKVSI